MMSRRLISIFLILGMCMCCFACSKETNNRNADTASSSLDAGVSSNLYDLSDYSPDDIASEVKTLFDNGENIVLNGFEKASPERHYYEDLYDDGLPRGVHGSDSISQETGITSCYFGSKPDCISNVVYKGLNVTKNMDKTETATRVDEIYGVEIAINLSDYSKAETTFNAILKLFSSENMKESRENTHWYAYSYKSVIDKTGSPKDEYDGFRMDMELQNDTYRITIALGNLWSCMESIVSIPSI